jgi:hypothetical protein
VRLDRSRSVQKNCAHLARPYHFRTIEPIRTRRSCAECSSSMGDNNCAECTVPIYA